MKDNLDSASNILSRAWFQSTTQRWRKPSEQSPCLYSRLLTARHVRNGDDTCAVLRCYFDEDRAALDLANGCLLKVRVKLQNDLLSYFINLVRTESYSGRAVLRDTGK